MAVLLWVVMLVLAAVAWFLRRGRASRPLQIAFATVEAAFSIWVVLTQLQVVGVWWLVVTVALSLVVAFWGDSQAKGEAKDPS
mgnify:FL=1